MAVQCIGCIIVHCFVGWDGLFSDPREWVSTVEAREVVIAHGSFQADVLRCHGVCTFEVQFKSTIITCFLCCQKLCKSHACIPNWE
jgi:hypothetical protein